MIKQLINSINNNAAKILSGGFTKKSIATGLDETVLSFFLNAPHYILPDSIVYETFYRMWKYATDFKKNGEPLDEGLYDKARGSEHSSLSERSSFAFTELKQYNNFNSESNRKALYHVEGHKIRVMLTKKLNTMPYTLTLDRLAQKVRCDGNASCWIVDGELYNLIKYITPQIQKDFKIIGFDKYLEDVKHLENEVEPKPILDIYGRHQVANKIIIDLIDDEFVVMCGNDLKEHRKIFSSVAKLDVNGNFIIKANFVKVIKLIIESAGEKVFLTGNAENSIEFLEANVAENSEKTISRGASIYPIQSVMTKQLSAVKFHITHFPHNAAFVSKAANSVAHVKRNKNQTIITTSDTNEIEKISSLHADFEIPTYTFIADGQHFQSGDNVFLNAYEYLDVSKDKPLATLTYDGGASFRLKALSTSKEGVYTINSQEALENLQGLIEKFRPICDAVTLEKYENLEQLGSYSCSTKNGKLLTIKPISGAPLPSFDFLPPHASRRDGDSLLVIIQTVSHGLMLKNILDSKGFLDAESKEACFDLIDDNIASLQAKYDLSKGTDGTLTPLNFKAVDKIEPSQKTCVEYMTPIKRGLIGDKPGFGKTWEAIAIISHNDAFPLLVIMPPIGKLPWEAEVNNLLIDKTVITAGDIKVRKQQKSELHKYDVVLVPYSLLDAFKDELMNIKFKSVVVDESHYTKHFEALRTQHTHDICANSNPEFILALSGSHWENNPAEFWSTIKLLGKQTLFGGKANFLKRYCAPKDLKQTKAAQDKRIGQNLSELNEICRSHFMIRRDSKGGKDRKWRQRYIPLEGLELGEYNKQEELFKRHLINSISQDIDSLIQAKPDMAEHRNAMVTEKLEAKLESLNDSESNFANYSNCRKLLGLAKVPSATEYAKNLVEQEEKIVVFAHHISVQEALFESFVEAGIDTCNITGGMNPEEKHENATKFLKGNKQAIICSIGAASENVNLASAAHVMFVESVPKPPTQARMRIDRHPQTSDILNAVYLRAFGTLDDSIFDSAEAKYIKFLESTGEKPDSLIQFSEKSCFKSLLLSEINK